MKIQQWVFDRDRWVSAPRAGEAPSEITVVTYNTWFGRFYFEERMEALIDELAGCDADVIALQEVTRPLLDMLAREPWVRDRYWLSDVGGTTFTDYGVVLLSRLPAERIELHELPSYMNRAALVAHLPVGAMCTVHLESNRGNHDMRCAQLQTLFEILEPESNAIVMGDFNFAPPWPENDLIDPRYIDLWPHLRPNDPGYTEDTAINLMRKQVTEKDKQVRFDRILLRSARGDLEPKQIDLLGTTAISLDPAIFPSDHFGLRARLSSHES